MTSTPNATSDDTRASEATGTTPAPLRVAYLVSQYPAISHAFIEREILALRERGVDVRTYSVRPCPPEQLISGTMRQEAAATRVVLDGTAGRAGQLHRAAAIAGLLASAPTAWGATLVSALRTGDTTARARLWQTFYFAEAAILYQWLKDAGIRHLHVHFSNVAADVARLVVQIGRRIDGPDAGWRWSMSVHGPAEFSAVDKVDLPAKVADADGVAAITDFCRSQLMRLVDPALWPRLGKVAMSVDESRYSPSDSAREPGPLRLLYVGRLVPEKGGPILLEAVADLRARGVDVVARVVGAGPLREPLERQAAQLGLSEVVDFTGPIGQDALPEQYRWADVFVLPSFAEGLPVVIMEAMATGLPIVTTRIAGIAELVVDGDMGRVVSAGRADEIADAIAWLADDEALRRRLGAAGREAVLAAHACAVTSADMEDFLRGVRPRS